MISLKFCNVVPTVFGCTTTFKDSSTSSNWPPGDEAFARVARECGFNNLLEYIFDHDLAHAFLAEKLFDAPSPVLWEAAHGGCLGGVSSLYEERLVYHWQRFANDLITPLELEWTYWYNEYKYLMGS